ncbi:MAG: cation-translocating P-type ATPase [Lachnospiraceae bacterium]|nr:cation-translocating P-type ATPase [Lachnospiraceae bacterium]
MNLEEKLKGLSDEQVLKSREQYGKNEIQEAEPETFLQKVLESLKDPMLMLLMGIATFMLVLSFFGQAEWYEPVGTFIAVALVAFISARTEMSSDKKYRELKNSTKAEPIKVYRNGVLTVVDVSEIVVGDIVVLQNGDKIPADGTLIQGDIRVNNASLNGETEECKKFAAAEDWQFPDEVKGDTLVDKHSLFKGTTIYNGEGIMEVAKVGMATMMGEMAADMADEDVDSPLKVKLTKLAGQISTFGYIGAIAIAIVYMVHFIMLAGGFGPYFASGGMNILKDVIEAATIAIMIVVCAVPEGLHLMIALVLQANTSKMLEANVLVRKAIGIETAGSLNILYSDKTGTITKGILEVTTFFTADGNEIALDKISEKAGKVKGLLDLSIGKNTSAMYDDKHNVIGGNLTDHALLKFLGEDTYVALYEDKKSNVTLSQSFNSSNKFSQSYIEGLKKTFYKGAPERLVTKATKCLDASGKVVDLDKDVLNAKIDELANRAMRVLAFGYSEKKMVEDKINDDIVLIGLVGIRDDVRPEAKQAIEEVQGAGIQVVMITGDRLETAVAIGKEAALLTGKVDVLTPEDIIDDTKVLAQVEEMDTVALSSDALNKLSDDTIKKILPKIRVIARALPKDKSRMVKLTQELNLVCGMTGDGVNDSPALKRADVGFAMGSGTEAAKEAGDLVIIDDNFLSIKNAVWYGRTIYENILKFVIFQLTINVSAVLISAVLPFLGIEAPLTVTHLLFVNLCMDSLGALLLGQEPALIEYMKKAPRRRDESIVSKKMFIQFCIMGAYLFILSLVWFESDLIEQFFTVNGELNMAQFKTGFFAAFMFSAILNGFNVRNDGLNIFKNIKKNGNFIKVLGAMLLATLAICQLGLVIPVVGSMFSTTPLTVLQLAVVLVISVAIILVDLLRKLVCGTYKTK